VRLVSPIGSAAGGSGSLSTSLSNVARLTAHPKFLWVFNANYDGTIIYNDLYILIVGFRIRQTGFYSNFIFLNCLNRINKIIIIIIII
jgi:hypothetical protein